MGTMGVKKCLKGQKYERRQIWQIINRHVIFKWEFRHPLNNEIVYVYGGEQKLENCHYNSWFSNNYLSVPCPKILVSKLMYCLNIPDKYEPIIFSKLQRMKGTKNEKISLWILMFKWVFRNPLELQIHHYSKMDEKNPSNTG